MDTTANGTPCIYALHEWGEPGYAPVDIFNSSEEEINELVGGLLNAIQLGAKEISVTALLISQRAISILRDNQVHTIGQFVQTYEAGTIKTWRRVGVKAMEEYDSMIDVARRATRRWVP